MLLFSLRKVAGVVVRNVAGRTVVAPGCVAPPTGDPLDPFGRVGAMSTPQPSVERPTVTMDDIKNRWTERVVRPARSGVTQVVTYRGHDACKLMPAEEFEASRESHPIATTEYKAYDAKRLRAEIVRACEEEGHAALVSVGGRRPVFAFVPLGYPTL